MGKVKLIKQAVSFFDKGKDVVKDTKGLGNAIEEGVTAGKKAGTITDSIADTSKVVNKLDDIPSDVKKYLNIEDVNKVNKAEDLGKIADDGIIGDFKTSNKDKIYNPYESVKPKIDNYVDDTSNMKTASGDPIIGDRSKRQLAVYEKKAADTESTIKGAADKIKDASKEAKEKLEEMGKKSKEFFNNIKNAVKGNKHVESLLNSKYVGYAKAMKNSTTSKVIGGTTMYGLLAWDLLSDVDFKKALAEDKTIGDKVATLATDIIGTGGANILEDAVGLVGIGAAGLGYVAGSVVDNLDFSGKKEGTGSKWMKDIYNNTTDGTGLLTDYMRGATKEGLYGDPNNTGIDKTQERVDELQRKRKEGDTKKEVSKEDEDKAKKIVEDSEKRRLLITNPDGTVSFISKNGSKLRTFATKEEAIKAISFGIANDNIIKGKVVKQGAYDTSGDKSYEENKAIVDQGDVNEIKKVDWENELGNKDSIIDESKEDTKANILKELETNDEKLTKAVALFGITDEVIRSKGLLTKEKLIKFIGERMM